MARHHVTRLWLGGHKIFSSDLPAIHAAFARLDGSFADECAELGVEAAVDSLTLAKRVLTGEQKPPRFGLEPLFAWTLQSNAVTTAHVDSTGLIARHTQFNAHDARGDVRANMALLLHPSFRGAITGVAIAPLLDRCKALYQLHLASVLGKSGKYQAGFLTCGTHGTVKCKQVRETNPNHAGYVHLHHMRNLLCIWIFYALHSL